MKQFSITLTFLVLIFLWMAPTAHAQVTRTRASGGANPRSAEAISKTAAGGEMSALDFVFNALTGINASGDLVIIFLSTIRIFNNDIYNNNNGISISIDEPTTNKRLAGNGPSTPPNGTPITIQ